MKQLMENWKKFIDESQYITINESGLQPKFMENFILGEQENNQAADVDPQSYSVEDLKEIPSEQMQQIYQKMLKLETDNRVSARMEKFKPLNVRGKALSQQTKLDKGSGDGDSIGDTIKMFINKMFGTEFVTSQIKKAQNKAELEDLSQQINKIFITAFNPLEREIIRAISLFTGADVPTVRAPDKFEPKMAEVLRMVNDGLVDIFTPSKETYQKAKIILDKLVDSPLEDSPTAWRGMAVYEKSGRYPGLKTYAVGRTIDLGNIISFSVDQKVAVDFADRESNKASSIENPLWGVVLFVPELKRGVDVDEFSQFEGVEEEIIVSGKFKITDMGWAPKFLGKATFVGVRDGIAKIVGHEHDLHTRATVYVELEQI